MVSGRLCFNGAATQEGKTQHDAQNSSHCDNALFVAVDRVRGAAHAMGRGDLARARKSPCSCPQARRIRPRHASSRSILTAGGERANQGPQLGLLEGVGSAYPKSEYLSPPTSCSGHVVLQDLRPNIWPGTIFLDGKRSFVATEFGLSSVNRGE